MSASAGRIPSRGRTGRSKADPPNRACASAAQARTLIVISCSDKKRKVRARAPAEDVYDGVFFKVLRKTAREKRLAPATDVIIVSAKFGIIGPRTLIPYYDLRLSKERARLIEPQVQRDLRWLLLSGSYKQICINLGKIYASMIADMPELKEAIWATGPIGKRAAVLKNWLSK